jgi:hypothetical protein
VAEKEREKNNVGVTAPWSNTCRVFAVPDGLLESSYHTDFMEIGCEKSSGELKSLV